MQAARCGGSGRPMPGMPAVAAPAAAAAAKEEGRVTPHEAWMMWNRMATDEGRKVERDFQSVIAQAYALGRRDQLEQCYPQLGRPRRRPEE